MVRAAACSRTWTKPPGVRSRPEYDLLIKNVRVVRPHGNAVHDADIAIAGGKFAKVAPAIDPSREAKASTTARAGSRFRAWWTRTCTAASTRRSTRTR